MSISSTLQGCLSSRGSHYDVVQHLYTYFTCDTAEAAHVPGDRLAKTVLFADGYGYVAAVLPSTYHVQLPAFCATTGRNLELAEESDLRNLFPDCQLGALPPVAMAYGVPTYMDESLIAQPDIYFEAGDHQELIHMRLAQFLKLMSKAEKARFAERMH